MRYAVGVDIGGSSAKLGIVSDDGEILLHHTLSTPLSNEPREVAATYSDAIDYLLAQCQEIEIQPEGIGIGIPGHLSDDRKMSTFNNVHTLDNFPLVDYLVQQFHCPVVLDNDATLAALAEHRFGAGRGTRRLIVMTVGSGIGAGLIIDGIPQRPIRGCIGDPGHIIVDPNSCYRCGYGCKGCLEAVASAIAIEREAMTLAQQFPDSEIGKLSQRCGSLTTSDVIAIAQRQGQIALQIITQAGHWLGVALASWCAIYDPDLILIGGGVSAAGDHLLTPIRRTVIEYGAPLYVSNLRISRAQLGNDAGMIGAASLLWQSGEERTMS